MKAGFKAFNDRVRIALSAKWSVTKDIHLVRETADLYIDRYAHRADQVESVWTQFVQSVKVEVAA